MLLDNIWLPIIPSLLTIIAVVLGAIYLYKKSGSASSNQQKTAKPEDKPRCEEPITASEATDTATAGGKYKEQDTGHLTAEDEEENEGSNIEEADEDSSGGKAAPYMCPFMAIMAEQKAKEKNEGKATTADTPHQESPHPKGLSDVPWARQDVYDPLEYHAHTQAEFKKVRSRVASRLIAKELSEEQLEEEKEVQEVQMSQIFKLLREHEEKFGVHSLDEMQQQMKLYM
ncbi:matrix-remodeling-associated protein 7 [Lingula anatina]|uniref:Matrix-remodeling-associated protein 7 n=1 Tax=Lingula anatina TaxID=7574 RepID=A0A1S3I578_LINAN|nr:matrix-remodeling-associated protein 7 [Lingula anatina]|eukprot:XP_013393425.1 matrix-remodeling-associated protein 7 [Lingula anatina]